MTCPKLRKVEGDDSINSSYSVSEAHFLIGKSWDASLNLPITGVVEKHCTLEKVTIDDWILICHEQASIQRNDCFVQCGLPVRLKCGDLIRITSRILFRFECTRLDCDKCTNKDWTVSPCSQSANSGQDSIPTTSNRILLENASVANRLLSQNTEFLNRLEKAETSFDYCKEDTNKLQDMYSSKLNCYYNIVQNYRELLKVKEQLEEYQDNEIKLMNTIMRLQNKKVSLQSDTIEKLQSKLNHKYNLRSPKNENESSVLEFTKEYNKLIKQLSDTKTDVHKNLVELKKKVQILEVTLEKHYLNKMKEMPLIMDGTEEMKNTLDRQNEAVTEVSRKLTELVQNEFKCVICNEILIEAVVTNCNHTFCKYCLNKWEEISLNPSCPICRNTSTKNMNAVVIDSFLNNFMPFIATSVMQNWKRLSEERQALKTAPALKKRKLNSNNGNMLVFPPSRSITINLDDAMDWGSVFTSIRSFTSNIESTAANNASNTTRIPASRQRRVALSSDVVDLTGEDNVD